MLTVAVPIVAQAEADSESGALQEITVTARKREESEMRTPVVVQVVSANKSRMPSFTTWWIS